MSVSAEETRSIYRAAAYQRPGTTSDPTVASAEKNEAVYEFIVKKLGDIVGEVAESNAAKVVAERRRSADRCGDSCL